MEFNPYEYELPLFIIKKPKFIDKLAENNDNIAKLVYEFDNFIQKELNELSCINHTLDKKEQIKINITEYYDNN